MSTPSVARWAGQAGNRTMINFLARVAALPRYAPPPPGSSPEGARTVCRHVAATHAGCQPAIRLRLTASRGACRGRAIVRPAFECSPLLRQCVLLSDSLSHEIQRVSVQWST